MCVRVAAQVQQTLAQIQGKVVSGLDLGKLDKASSGLGALGGKGAVVAGLGGNPVPSKVFEELMIELAQVCGHVALIASWCGNVARIASVV